MKLLEVITPLSIYNKSCRPLVAWGEWPLHHQLYSDPPPLPPVPGGMHRGVQSLAHPHGGEEEVSPSVPLSPPSHRCAWGGPYSPSPETICFPGIPPFLR